jgi:Pregnancy-associated plasma protein-A/GEVED domain/Secretion system C-terminal sorting domain
MKKRLLSLGIFFAVALSASAQVRKSCGFDKATNYLKSTNETYRQSLQSSEQKIQAIIANSTAQRGPTGTVYTIPVVVHVIHLGEAVGTGTNISNAQVQSAITNLNNVFRGTLGQPNDVEIQFVLAGVSPSGTSINGIDRINGTTVSGYAANGIIPFGSSFGAANETQVKNLANWDHNHYYNIWVVAKFEGEDQNGIQGFAYFPSAFHFVEDGIAILYNAFGYDPTSALGYNLKSFTNQNKTLVHEMGHAFNVFHTFEGDGDGTTCPANGNPATDGDRCADTDPHIQTAFNCPTGNNPCTGMPLGNVVKNYMDYSSETCQDRFTPNQITRMRASILATTREALTVSYAIKTSHPEPSFSAPAAICAASNQTAAIGLSANYAGINRVDVGSRILFSGSTKEDNGYLNGANNSMSLVRLEKSISTNINVKVHSVNSHQVKAWIDYNGNGTFEDATERILNVTSTAAGTTVTANFTPPATAVTTGYVRMRVMEDFPAGGYNVGGTLYTVTNFSACTQPVFGQIEDYAVKLYNLGTLPVKLNNFQINTNNCSNVLTAKFDDVSDLQSINIQRSSNGGNSFETIANLANSGLQYSYTDAHSATAVYRLEMKHKDGSSEFSQLVKALGCGKAQNLVQVFPNPAAQFINIARTDNKAATVNIINANGAVVLRSVIASNTTKLDIAHLANGLYTIQIQQDNEVQTSKFLKQ